MILYHSIPYVHVLASLRYHFCIKPRTYQVRASRLNFQLRQIAPSFSPPTRWPSACGPNILMLLLHAKSTECMCPRTDEKKVVFPTFCTSRLGSLAGQRRHNGADYFLPSDASTCDRRRYEGRKTKAIVNSPCVVVGTDEPYAS